MKRTEIDRIHQLQKNFKRKEKRKNQKIQRLKCELNETEKEKEKFKKKLEIEHLKNQKIKIRKGSNINALNRENHKFLREEEHETETETEIDEIFKIYEKNKDLVDVNDGAFGIVANSKKKNHRYSLQIILLTVYLSTFISMQQIPNIIKNTLNIYTANHDFKYQQNT